MTAPVTVEEALSLISSNPITRAMETLPLIDCLGRTLAVPVEARVTRPPAAVSAMDGYAVRLSDVSAPGTILTVIGEAPAGAPFLTPLKPGQAVRIFTGSELPRQADHVVPQEVTDRDGATVRLHQAYKAALNVRKAGIDFKAGDRLMQAGTVIGPPELAVAAAANHARLTVYKRPKVALLANGDELLPPGIKPARGQIINSNPYGLGALITHWGGEAVDLGIASDNVSSIQAFIENAQDADILLPVGGASVGDHDYMRAAFSGLGYEPVFESILVQPGKPTWFSTKGRQRVLGLPGNPASAFVCAHLFLAPLMNSSKRHALQPARLGIALGENGLRTVYLRGDLSVDAAGNLVAKPVSHQDSSLLTPFLNVNCLIRREAYEPERLPGSLVDVLMIGSL